MQQFAHLYQCEFHITPAAAHLREVAEQYVRDTEAYDRIVCTGPIIRGEIMPATQHERALISRNADQLFSRLLSQNAGRFTAQELSKEIGRIEARGQ